MEIYRQEHPNPQWERSEWRNLNGEWEFDFDFGKSARERKLYEGGALSKKSTFPSAPKANYRVSAIRTLLRLYATER